MLSIDVRGGRAGGGTRGARARRASGSRATFGDVSTTVSHPPSTSHRHLSAQAREALGISDGLLRFSIGIEDEQALLARARRARWTRRGDRRLPGRTMSVGIHHHPARRQSPWL